MMENSNQIVKYGYQYPCGIFNGKKVYKYSNPIILPDYSKSNGYINLPCSFDIESTTLEYNTAYALCATMYVWCFAIGQDVYIGRTWKELRTFLFHLIRAVKANSKNKIVVYIHNAAFEFGFFCRQLPFNKVFAIRNRKPLYFSTESIEFRCSYLQSGLSLAKLAEEFCGKDNQKLKGDLDYSKHRFANTPLYYEEVCYCVNDVTILTEYVQKQIIKWGDLSKIPYTKTGEVREHCRNACLYKDKKHNLNQGYSALMRELCLTPDEYLMLRRLYTGGFTHANWSVVNKVLRDIDSFDFCSSYPAVMCSELFPMSKGKLIKNPSFDTVMEYMKKYCVCVNVHFEGLESKFIYENYLSQSKCFSVVNGERVPLYKCKYTQINNGRVVSAPILETTICELDWDIICTTYTWKSIKFGRMIYYEKRYLPKQIIECVLEFYENKTKLKDVKGMEEIYQNNKEKLNSTYGMMVTDIVRDIFEFLDGEWKDPQSPDLSSSIEIYNNNKKRFLFYPWGVWIVKYATRNLWTAILTMKGDYKYSDTDSVKISNMNKYEEYFNKYNSRITYKINKCLSWYNIPTERACPVTTKGKIKPLGVWEHDKSYYKFKTLGAKRYLTEYMDNNYLEFEATVAGIPKIAMVNYLKKIGENNPDKIFELFTDNLCIPKGEAGKKLLTYIDTPTSGLGVDYLGGISEYSELNCVALTDNSFDMSLAEEFKLFLKTGIIQSVYE